MASICTLYNARNDAFLPFSLLNKELPPNGIESSNIPKEITQISYVNTYEEKFERLGLSKELGGSILAKLVRPSGSGCYLGETQESNKSLHAALYHKMTTVREKWKPMSSEFGNCLSLTALESGEATHVVTGIEWGAQSVVTARHRFSDGVARSSIEGQFCKEIEAAKSVIEKSGPVNHRVSNGQAAQTLSLEVTAYSDFLTSEGVMMHNLQEAVNFLALIPLEIKDKNGGRGVPMNYTILPISVLAMILEVDIRISTPATPPSTECLKKFVQLFDKISVSKQKLNDYYSFVSKRKFYIPPSHTQAVVDRVGDTRDAQNSLQAKYAGVLQDVRGGTSDPEKLWQLLQEFSNGDLSPERITSLVDEHRERVEFIDMMVAQGATYIGYNGLDLNTELARQRDPDAYIFWFSGMAKQDRLSWNANQSLLQELLNTPHHQCFIAIVDCDATGASLDKSRITHLQDGEEVSNDMLEQRQFLAGKCFARYSSQSLETRNVQKPVKRRFVKIPCPGSHCDPGEVCDWICVQCHAPLEYGYSDQYIYCECGRSLFNNYDFKCKNELHGPNYDKYNQTKLGSFLKNLKQSDYLNILILGESGVGKSTFINAFVNYLTFETLDQSMKADKLNWVIPCSFSTQTMDRSSPNGKITETEIKVGSRADEHDGSKGASATQQTTVYPVTIGSSTIRLIDTPGIGDTRGFAYDQKNMADILSTIGSYDELHGILILVKSNNARLTVTFSFCIKELLVHLHRSASENIAFGFTNTRISNYTPGDTFGPLKALIGHPDIQLSLSGSTTYCFDSESFRYLAAFKNGVIMDNQEDFRRSWKHSRDEALRLLDHFRSKQPHLVKSTMSLNGARELISELTKPMAEISQLIRTNVAMCEDRLQELTDTRVTGDQLRKRLQLQKIRLEAQPLDKHRTVCQNKSCVDQKDDGNGENKVVTIYKTHCHAECWLEDVKVDMVGAPGLIGCAAFAGTGFCQGSTCHHSWQEHLHVLYELHERKFTVNDSEIERQLRENASDVTLRLTAIKQAEEVIREYRNEHEQIQQAAIHFGMFLKKYSITPINDATLSYLDFLIKEEKAKVEAGGSKRRLEALQEDRQRYEENIKVLTANMKSNGNYKPLDEAGVDRVIKHLYNLKHFGKNLKSVQQTITTAHQSTYREMPYRVKVKGSWGWSTFKSQSQVPRQMIPLQMMPYQTNQPPMGVAHSMPPRTMSIRTMRLPPQQRPAHQGVRSVLNPTIAVQPQIPQIQHYANQSSTAQSNTGNGSWKSVFNWGKSS
ncbi:MAG: hypothetical protein MMC33_010032 [Icmadophila ericetorum]|nr:hypothetical protein [Icmadophila ericetorum]